MNALILLRVMNIGHEVTALFGTVTQEIVGLLLHHLDVRMYCPLQGPGDEALCFMSIVVEHGSPRSQYLEPSNALWVMNGR